MGSSEFVLIGIALLILFGGKQLPGFLRNVAKIIANFRRMTDQLKREAGLDVFDEIVNPPRRPRPPMPPPPSSNKKEGDESPLPPDKED